MITYRSKKPIYLTSDNCNDTLNDIFYRRYFVRNKLSDEQKEKTFTLLKKNGDTRNIDAKILEQYPDLKSTYYLKEKKDSLKHFDITLQRQRVGMKD